MKKLHILILRSFVGPFILTFFIAQFVLLMQFLWKYIDDLIGKGLDGFVIAELLFYTSANLVPLALPLAILVSSIMTFGNLAEHFEITACKAAGISLQKLMAPLFIVALLISATAFIFSNNVLPYTNLRMGSLLYDIRQQKPSLAIREGIFYGGIDGYSIKVGKKDRDGKTIHNVMIYDHSLGQGNRKIVVAESGKMESTPDQKYLKVNLINGSSYEEQSKIRNGNDIHPLMRTNFKEYKISFDLSQFKLSRTNEDLFKSGQQMMNMNQLTFSIDSFQQKYVERQKESIKTLVPYFTFLRDSKNYLANINKVQPVNIMEKYPIPGDAMAFENAMSQARTLQSYLTSIHEDLDSRRFQIAKYKVEWHRKLTLSIACFILFLIGAPLGAIIRKGGMGMPLVISIAFFLVYHVTSITGEKFAKEGIVSPFSGMWLSAMILLPVGLFLIYKATHDSAIFDSDVYKQFFKRLFKSLKKA